MASCRRHFASQRQEAFALFLPPEGSPSNTSQTQSRFQFNTVHLADDEDVRQYSYQIHHSYEYQSSVKRAGGSEDIPNHERSHNRWYVRKKVEDTARQALQFRWGH